MKTMYSPDGSCCTVDKEQVKLLAAEGWSTEPPKKEVTKPVLKLSTNKKEDDSDEDSGSDSDKDSDDDSDTKKEKSADSPKITLKKDKKKDKK